MRAVLDARNLTTWSYFVRLAREGVKHYARFVSERIFSVHISCKGLQGSKVSLDLDFRIGMPWSL